MPDDTPELLVLRGRPSDTTRIVLQPHLYNTLMRLVRIATPSESAGVLIGDAVRSGAQELFTIQDVQPVGLAHSDEGKVLDVEELAELRGKPTRRGATRPGIIGWFYADPNLAESAPKLDFAQIEQDLGEGAGLFLLVDPAREEGAFYAWAGDSFVPTEGFYEALPHEGAEPVIPWRGEVSGAEAWLPVTEPPAPTLVEQPQATATDEAPVAVDAAESNEPAPTSTDVQPGTEEVLSAEQPAGTESLLIALAETFEAEGAKDAARETYRYALDLVQPDSPAANEILGRLHLLESWEPQPPFEPLPRPEAEPPVETGAEAGPEHEAQPVVEPMVEPVVEPVAATPADLAEAQVSAAATEPAIERVTESESGSELEAVYYGGRPSGVPQRHGPPTTPLAAEPGGARAGRDRVPPWGIALGLGFAGFLLLIGLVWLLGGPGSTAQTESRTKTGVAAGATPTFVTQALPQQGEGGAPPRTPPADSSGANVPPAAAQPTATVPAPAEAAATPPPATMPPTEPPAQPTPVPPSPTAEIAPTPAPPAADVVLQRVAAAESAIQSGQLQATLTNRDGSSSSADLLFNLGEQQSISSFHITTMYTTTSGVTTLEQIVIKDAAWERRDGGPWTRVPVQEGAWGQIRAFMPQAGSVNAPAANEGVTELRWYDADRDSDCLLLVDPASGVPKELRRVARSSGATLVVTYGGWNTTVDIQAPATP